MPHLVEKLYLCPLRRTINIHTLRVRRVISSDKIDKIKEIEGKGEGNCWGEG